MSMVGSPSSPSQGPTWWNAIKRAASSTWGALSSPRAVVIGGASVPTPWSPSLSKDRKDRENALDQAAEKIQKLFPGHFAFDKPALPKQTQSAFVRVSQKIPQPMKALRDGCSRELSFFTTLCLMHPATWEVEDFRKIIRMVAEEEPGLSLWDAYLIHFDRSLSFFQRLRAGFIYLVLKQIDLSKKVESIVSTVFERFRSEWTCERFPSSVENLALSFISHLGLFFIDDCNAAKEYFKTPTSLENVRSENLKKVTSNVNSLCEKAALKFLDKDQGYCRELSWIYRKALSFFLPGLAKTLLNKGLQTAPVLLTNVLSAQLKNAKPFLLQKIQWNLFAPSSPIQVNETLAKKIQIFISKAILTSTQTRPLKTSEELNEALKKVHHLHNLFRELAWENISALLSTHPATISFFIFKALHDYSPLIVSSTIEQLKMRPDFFESGATSLLELTRRALKTSDLATGASKQIPPPTFQKVAAQTIQELLQKTDQMFQQRQSTLDQAVVRQKQLFNKDALEKALTDLREDTLPIMRLLAGSIQALRAQAPVIKAELASPAMQDGFDRALVPLYQQLDRAIDFAHKPKEFKQALDNLIVCINKAKAERQHSPDSQMLEYVKDPVITEGTQALVQMQSLITSQAMITKVAEWTLKQFVET